MPATLNADGMANVLGVTEVGAFALAAVNLGAPDTVTAVADTGTTSLPVTVALCRTDRMTGVCLSPTAPAPSVTSHVAADETLTFAVFVTARGAIPFDPAASRISVRFEDSSGATRGSASVAVRTLSPVTGPPTASGGALIAPDGAQVLALNVEARSVAVIDTNVEAQVAEVVVGAEPRSLATSRDWRRLYVTLDDPPALAVVEMGTLTVTARIPVGAAPYGVVADPHGDLVYVASAARDRVEVVHVGLGRVIAEIPVGARPKGLALSADARRLLVTHFFTGQVSVIDTLRRAVLGVITTGADSNMAQKVAIHPLSGLAYMPHIRSNTANRSLLFDTTVFPLVSALDPDSLQAVPAERVDLSLGEHSVNMPFDLAFSPDGARGYVTNLGSGDLSVISFGSRRKLADIDVGGGPRSVVVSPNGARAFVVNSLSSDVSVVDLALQQEIKRIPLTSSPLPAVLKRGKLLFFSSRERELSKERWMSCASCHFEGEHDGRTWLFAGSGRRNTTSLRGAEETRPLHWSADRDEVQDFEFTIRQLQAGTGLIREGSPNATLGAPNAGLSADLDALAAFVDSLRFKASPFLTPAGTLTIAAQRGEAVFMRSDVGCAACHPPPRFTDTGAGFTHDVGTGNGPDEAMGAAFDTPTLRGIWDTAPYLHDGSAATLRDVLTTRNASDRHGRTAHLTEAEIQDLMVYLRSL